MTPYVRTWLYVVAVFTVMGVVSGSAALIVAVGALWLVTALWGIQREHR